MLNSAIIIFREVLEAALIVTIVLAATRGVANRNRWILAGIGAGVLGALLVASVTEQISMAFEGIGQELFNALILLTAVVMLAWHNIWMARHARALTAHLKQVGQNVASGSLPMYFLATAVGVAVLREGSEIVLFMYGLAAGGNNPLALLIGGLFGLAAGALLGYLLYRGLLRIPVSRLFTVTGWMILLLASGMAANAAMYLSQAGWLPSQPPLWDTSGALSEHSLAGQVFHVVVGYQERPTPMELGFYLVTLTLIAAGMLLVRQSGKQHVSS